MGSMHARLSRELGGSPSINAIVKYIEQYVKASLRLVLPLC